MNILEKLNVNESRELYVALPNEVFTDLVKWKDDGKIKASHIPFTYCYLYITTYMYRYGKYSYFMATQSDIKEMINYAHNNKTVNYIITKNGLLDTELYTETTTDIPIEYKFHDGADTLAYVEVVTVNSMKELDIDVEWYKNSIGATRRSTVKLPRFAYTRDLTLDLDEDTGTFYESDNTHLINIKAFEFCMSKDDLGATGFYLYSYLKHKGELFGDYDASTAKLGKELGLSSKTIQNYRDALRKYNLIELIHNMDRFNSSNRAENKAPTNKVNDVFLFNSQGIDYLKFQQHLEKVKEIEVQVKNGTSHKLVEVPIELLPF